MARRIPWLVLSVAVSSALVADCSLLGLDHLDLPHCTANTDCEPLNTSNNIGADACMRYQCQLSSGACVLATTDADGDGDPPIRCQGTDCDDHDPNRAGTLAERCDGIDNNCNLVIDDGVIRPRTSMSIVTGLPAGTGSYAAAPMGQAGFAFASGQQTASFNVLSGPSASPMTPQASEDYSIATNPTAGQPPEPQLHVGCDITALGSQVLMTGVCNIAESAVAPADPQQWLIAAVNTQSCRSGQLRIGYMTPSESSFGASFPNVILRGTLAYSNIDYGVDPERNDTNLCTGNTLGTYGAARPAIASLLGASVPAQGLVAFLGTTFQRPTCGDGMTMAAVEAIGAWLVPGTAAGQTIHWVTGTNTGVPQVLAMTSGGGRPAVAGWTGASARGYFVAYGNASGHAEIRFVSALGTPPTPDSTMTYTPGPSPPLTLDAPFALPAGGTGGADQVAIAIGRGDASGTDVGVSWIEGCGASPTLYFSRAHYTAGSPGHWTSSTPVSIATTASSAPATMAYVSDGFVLPMYTRNGMTAATGSTGGWVLAWADSTQRVLAVRVAELDAEPLTETPIVISASGASMPAAPYLYAADASQPLLLRFAYLDGTGTLTGGDLLCGNGASL